MARILRFQGSCQYMSMTAMGKIGYLHIEQRGMRQ